MDATKMLITGLDKELVEALKQQAKRDSINRTPEQIEAIKEQQEENTRIEEMREEAIRHLRESGAETAKYCEDELETKNNGEIPYALGLFLFVLIIGGFFFMIWWFVIRKIRNNIRDLSYTKDDVQDKMNYAMNDSRFEKMSDKERESVEKMKKFLNRKS